MKAVLVALAAMLALVVAGVAVLVAVLMADTSNTDSGTVDCASGDIALAGAQSTGDITAPAPPPVRGVAGLDADQRRNAATIVAVGKSMGITPKGLRVALVMARQESGLRNLASQAEPGSLAFPHDAVAKGDHDSVGIAQQRAGWGSMDVRMHVDSSMRLFYAALRKIDYESMDTAAAAQAVQRSAFPTAYTTWESLADEILSTYGDVTAAAVDTGTCSQAAAPLGTTTYPVRGATDQHNYGNGGASWAHGHTGTDLSVDCGTPVVAATGGTVIIDTTQPWAGRWLVKISTGPGALTTWYAHMQALDVSDGQVVQPGQRIGDVGQEGNATGCHLHFEVHPKGGSIYQDGVNPSDWLAANVGKGLTGTIPAVSNGHDTGGGFVIASLNVLGSSHTKGHGTPGVQRVRAVPRLFDLYGIEIAGLQELQGDQAAEFARITRGTWSMHHPPRDTENAIVWRTGSYTMVDSGAIEVPYFRHNRDMPWVVLADNAGHRAVFLNVHNPADVHGPEQRDRDRAVTMERDLVERLHDATGLPVFWTGDMNDRDRFYCPATAGGVVHAAAGERTNPCRAPRTTGIDWIMATPEVRFSGWTHIKTDLIRHTTDHPLAFARASVPN